TAEGLHGGIVDHLHRASKGSGKIELDPAAREIVWLGGHAATENQPRVADRDHVVLPIPGDPFHSGNHPSGRHGLPGWKLPRDVLPARQNLDVGSAYINREYFHERPPQRECFAISSRIKRVYPSGASLTRGAAPPPFPARRHAVPSPQPLSRCARGCR